MLLHIAAIRSYSCIAMKGHHLDDASGWGLGAPWRRLRQGASCRFFCARTAHRALRAASCCSPAVSRSSPPMSAAWRRRTDLPTADAIIVLTGGQARLDAALELLKSGKGERLLISGVHPVDQQQVAAAATGGDRRCSPAASTSTMPRSTRSATPRKAPNGCAATTMSRVILVTNNYHMPRSLLEMGRLLDREELDPYPVVNSKLDDGGWMVKPDALRVLFTEYNKYLAGAGARRACRVRRSAAKASPVMNASAAGRTRPHAFGRRRFLFRPAWCNQRATHSSSSRPHSMLYHLVRWRSTSPSTSA